VRADLQTPLSSAQRLCTMRHMKLLAFLTVVFLAALPVHAADEAEHPLDKKIGPMIENAGSTADMLQAYDKGVKLWDAELNRCYVELKKKLKPDAFTALQAAQRQWLEYRDAQFKFIAAFYGHFDGTMYIPMRSAAAMQVVRQRALELHHTLEVFAEHEQ
jgi:uncharacterized protein YecT (DUF1311 family)